ncbi:MAG TPA: EAL domain-containing protein [Thermoleophilaceae bacterium]|jgi:diguanylate cyclase (GGDEF)-like protein
MSWILIVTVDALVVGAVCAVAWSKIRRRPTEQEQLEQHFEHQLLHDDLTKLPNRTLFRDRLERALARSVRRRQSCAVLSVDIDRFALVNDSLGPAVGDRLLREAGARLDTCLRPEDSVARTGGDEFMVLLETVRNTAEATAVAERLTEALAPAFEVDGNELYLSASIGIAIGRGGRDRAEDVLQNADVAVHRAKEAGRARTEMFRQEMNPHPTERLGLETDLRRSVERMEFTIEYQPMVHLADGRVIGYEALLRWQHPKRGLVDPLEFIPVAEETGLILPLGRWVLKTACEQAAAWSELGDAALCVNLSSRQLQQSRLRLVDEVNAAYAGAGLEPARLCVEFTEEAVMGEVDEAIPAMEDLSRRGVEIVLDDFGTGYSSLNHLRKFPIDRVKIDRSFVRELTESEEGEAIVHALIDVCHALHAEVIAVGIESPEQASRLRDLGCDLGQGDHFSPPLPPDEIGKLLGSGTPLLGANSSA